MSAILSLNAGSSSIKFCLYRTSGARSLDALLKGKIEKIGLEPVMSARTGEGEPLEVPAWESGTSLSHEDLFAGLVEWISGHRTAEDELAGIGHRVVHGGTEFAAPTLIDESVIEKLEDLCPFAPLHQPHNLAAITAMAKLLPQVPQVACFDTSFHHDKPAVASRFALPREFYDRGIRRYGFHGISYEFIARQLREVAPELAAGRVIAAHLGNGASLCAMRNGKSIDTTMGFTALDGLMMGTRCGSIDPGVLLYLRSQLGMAASAVEDLLYRKSGLLGVSGISSDMRELETSPLPGARDAIELFAWRAAREIGALAASLGGIDAIVFSAGIGENDPAMRRRICDLSAWLEIKLQDSANDENALKISAPESRVSVLVIPTDEECMIAMHTARLLKRQASGVAQKDDRSMSLGPIQAA